MDRKKHVKCIIHILHVSIFSVYSFCYWNISICPHTLYVQEVLNIFILLDELLAFHVKGVT